MLASKNLVNKISLPVAAVSWDLIKCPLFVDHSAINGTPIYIPFLEAP